MQDNSYLLLRAVGGRLWRHHISKWMWQKILICRDSLVLLQGFKKQNSLCEWKSLSQRASTAV